MGKTRREGHGGVAVVALTALVLAFTLEGLRAFFPAVYTYREGSGLAAAVLVGVLVFLAPVVASVLVRALGGGRAQLAVAVVLGGLRVTLQSVVAFGVGLAAAAAAVGLVALAVVLTATKAHRMELAFGMVAGLALDTVLRASWTTWDRVWSDSVAAWLVTAALAVGLVVTAWIVHRGRVETTPAGAWRGGLAVGPFLALEVLLLQNPAFATSSGGVALATGVAVILVGDVLALGAIPLVNSGFESRGATAGAASVLMAIVWLATATTGSAVFVLMVAGQALAVFLVARVLLSDEPAGRHQVVAGTAGFGMGTLIFGLLVVGYQLHYDRPLPVTNRWLPLVGATILGAVAVTARAVRREPGASRLSERWALAGAATVVVVGVLAVGALVSGEPALSPAVAEPHSLRVMTYNVHEAVTRDGRLDPEAMARTVEQLRPDVLVLEEVGRGWPLSAGIDLAEWSKRRLGMRDVWAPSADNQFGNVMLSRVPIISARVLDLPRGSGPMNRSAIVARVGPVDGEVVTVVGAHLQNGEAPARVAARIAELREILRALGDGTNAVIAGDLNSDPASPELEVLLDAGYRTTQPTRRCTLKTSNSNCVDWIFVSSDLAQGRVRAVAVDTFDHRPLLATVRPRR